VFYHVTILRNSR